MPNRDLETHSDQDPYTWDPNGRGPSLRTCVGVFPGYIPKGDLKHGGAGVAKGQLSDGVIGGRKGLGLGLSQLFLQ